MNTKILNLLIITIILSSVGVALADTSMEPKIFDNKSIVKPFYPPFYSPFYSPFYMNPYIMFYSGDSDMFMNYLMWSMIFDNSPRSSYSSYNYYDSGSTYVRYTPTSESGWSVRTPIEERIVENEYGEFEVEEVGFYEPDVPEGYNDYVNGNDEFSSENDGLLTEDAINEAESSNAATSYDGVDEDPSPITDVDTGEIGNPDEGFDTYSGGESDYGGDSDFGGDSGSFDGGDSGSFDGGDFGGGDFGVE